VRRPRLSATLLLAAALPTALLPAQAWGQKGGKPLEAVARSHYTQALSLMEQGQLEAAIPLFEKAHAEGGFKNALWNLAEVYRRLAKPTRALALLEKYQQHPRVVPEEIKQAQAALAQLRALLAGLRVEANLAGAAVAVDGQEVGRIPVDLDLDPGRHFVEVRSPGFATASTAVELVPASKSKISLVLRTLPGRLSVTTTPPGALLFIGGKPVGQSPHTMEAPAGAMVLEARLKGHRPVQRHVGVAPGERIQVELTLPPRSASLAVSVDLPRADVTLDDRHLGRTPLEPLQVKPGRHVLSVHRQGYDTWKHEVLLNDRETAQVVVQMRRGSLSPVWFGIATAVAVALLGGGTGLAVDGRSVAGDFRTGREALASGGVPPASIAAERMRLSQLASQSSARFDQAAVVFALAGGAAVTAGVLALFTRWRRSEATVLNGPAEGGAGGNL
jgi:hypothetical protein